jgi:glutathione S-transferase
MTVALYYSPGSCSLAPHIVLNEIGQPFELRKFSTADRHNYSPEYLAVNPKGRIPALQIDGFILDRESSHPRLPRT